MIKLKFILLSNIVNIISEITCFNVIRKSFKNKRIESISFHKKHCDKISNVDDLFCKIICKQLFILYYNN